MFRRMLTPEMASEVLRYLADGTFPSVIWDDIYNRHGLQALLDAGRKWRQEG